jgi:hypothetical protein
MEGNIGLAMLIMAAIFLGAAIYRKRFLNMIFNSLQKGKASFEAKLDTKKIIAANAALARKLGITDVLTDWWFSRPRNQGERNAPDKTKTNDNVLTPEIIVPEKPKKSRVWTGQPPKDWPYKEITGPGEYTGEPQTSDSITRKQPFEGKPYKQLLAGDQGKDTQNSEPLSPNYHQHPAVETMESGYSLDTARAVPISKKRD